MINPLFLLCYFYFTRKKQKTMVTQEKWEEGWASLKPVLQPSTHDSFLARIVFLIWGNVLSSRQIVTCKQHFLVTPFSANQMLWTRVSSHLANVYFCISKVTSTFFWAESTKRFLHSGQSWAITPSLGIIGVDHWGGTYIYIYVLYYM